MERMSNYVLKRALVLFEDLPWHTEKYFNILG
jgi:hypothetical protein